MRQIKDTTLLGVARDMYHQEKRVAESLAKHVAELLGLVNHHKPDWRVIYEAAHVREARDSNQPETPNTG